MSDGYYKPPFEAFNIPGGWMLFLMVAGGHFTVITLICYGAYRLIRAVTGL